MAPTPIYSGIDRIMRAWRDRALVRKAFSFAVVGAINAVVDFTVFSCAFYVVALSILAANLCAWIVAVTSSYVLNSMFTFAAESGRKLAARTYAGFVLSQVAGFVANTATVYIGSKFIHVLLAKVLAIGASFVVNFSLSHFVVFRGRHPAAPAPKE